MATTTNFGWETPDDTDLVKDGAAAMRTLGNSIDTSFVDLKGGTTGQVLAKASDTDLDFTWAADASGIPATIFDAKGDLIAATAADTAARLAVGTNGYVLTADSTASTGMKWASSGAAANFSLIGTGTTTSGSTVTVSGISGQNTLMILFRAISTNTAGSDLSIRLNSDTGSNYDRSLHSITQNSSTGVSMSATNQTGSNQMYIGSMPTGVDTGVFSGVMVIYGCNSAGKKMITYTAGADTPSSYTSARGQYGGGYWNNTSTVTSFSLLSGSGSFDSGSYEVYGSAS